jgi:hypothetical protein
MKITARERNLNMMMAILLDDEFLIDDHWMQFRKQGSDFLIAREKYISLGLNEIEKNALDKQRSVSIRSVELQYQIFDSVRNDDKERALELIEEAFEFQKKVFFELDKMLDYQQTDNEKRIEYAREYQKSSAKTVTVLSMSVVVIMILMTLYISRRLSQQAQFIQNEALKKQFKTAYHKVHFAQGSVLSHEGFKAAYENGKPWLEDLKTHLQNNKLNVLMNL